MTIPADVLAYNQAQTADQALIGEALAELFAKVVPAAEGKVWHGHPLWFLDQNPVVGYSIKKSGVQVLFWSGQFLEGPGLVPLGKFKAASWDVADVASLQAPELTKWLGQVSAIQWDYKNLPKLKKLEKLTQF